MRLFPIDDVVYRHAMLLSLRGDLAAAQRQWYLAIASYPAESEQALRVLERRVEDGLNAMQPLLDYARQQTMAGQPNERILRWSSYNRTSGWS